ncbi:exported hypothetical protein [metagenome]|uniref:Uncharacterized protein n=1 Tax=metagenome TaxID=256318 RepID=A0A2P2CE94_9ZZZZ
MTKLTLIAPSLVAGLVLGGAGIAQSSTQSSTQSAAPAAAAAAAKTTVTIRAEGTDLSGLVKSPRPKRCADGRTVIVRKQIGTRGGGDDIRFASDTAELDGTVAEWSTGNTGTPGRFYAVVRAKTGCQGDKSPTIRAVRNP